VISDNYSGHSASPPHHKFWISCLGKKHFIIAMKSHFDKQKRDPASIQTESLK
jgi:hypothetical protein